MRTPASCRILVMDDEPAVLKLMNMYLTRLGYSVEASLTGAGAWQKFSAAPQQYDLVIADLSIDDVNVPEMLERFPQLHSSVRVLVCSGHFFDTKTLPAAIRAQFSVLQKPFTPSMLASAVADALRTQASKQSAVA